MPAAVKDILTIPMYQDFRDTYYDELLYYVLDFSIKRPTWQQVDALKAIQEPGCRVAMSSGHGCFGRGTPILLSNGIVIPVEDVRVGDVLAGDDGGVRNVLELRSGRENLYRFTLCDGTEYVFNESHILCLVSTQSHGLQKTGAFVEVTVRDWLSWSDRKKNIFLFYRKSFNRITAPNPLKLFIKKVEPLGVGDYYGFIIDGNRRFLGGDMSVLHNTGKSFIMAWVLDWHLRVFPKSNALLTATNIEQARSVVWKYLDFVISDMDAAVPWMRGYFVKETKRYYAQPWKDSWYVIPKTASKDKPENMAGQHNIDYLVFVDEASGVADSIHGVLKGALTEERNRYIMASQPTRPVGHFAEAMTTLAKKPDGSGIYTALQFNSEESPIVSKAFLAEKIVEYGGHHSPEYQIKVLGRLPDNLSGYLIPKKWCEDCQHYSIEHEEAFGYVLVADVAEGVHRDSSVLQVFKVSGYAEKRKAESIDFEEHLDLNEKEFARLIASKYHQYPSLTVAVDADGAGRAVVLDLEEIGIPVERIHWGLPPHSDADKKRYSNLRAFSHLKLREAIFEERFKGPLSKKFVEQASRLPYKIDERGRYVMMPKEQMKNEGLKSPDISDTCCFVFLVDYIPAEETTVASEENAFLAMAKAALESAQ